MLITFLQDTVLKRTVAQSSNLPECDKKSYKKGDTIEVKSATYFKDSHYQLVFDDLGNIWYGYGPHLDIRGNWLINEAQLKRVVPSTHFKYLKEDKIIAPLNTTLLRYEINTRYRIAAFVAQVLHESGYFRYSEEIASGKAYEGRKDLGNVFKGDGEKYKGRGFIMLTGRANYREFGLRLGINLESNPDLVLEPRIAWLVAGEFWDLHRLNVFADLGNQAGFDKITRVINGGYNGKADRDQLWKKLLTVL